MGGAKNCPETPRQKMIGMMYLVLTAMLALNVSSEILNGFTMVDNSLHQTILSSDIRNEALYRDFEDLEKINPDKVKEWMDKAKEVKEKSDSLYNYIQDFKYEIIKLADGDDADPNAVNIIAKDNLDVAGQYALNDNARNGKYLKRNLADYCDYLVGFLNQNDSSKIRMYNTIFSTEPTNHVPWENAIFEMMPVSAVVTVLTKYQSDIRSAEAEIVQYLKNQTDAGDFRVNKIEALVVPNSRYVIRGGTYSAQIVLSAVDSTVNTTYIVNGQNIKNGLYEVTANSTGTFTYSGEILMPQNDGSIRPYPFKSDYVVGEPSATLSNEDLNVVYRGIDNKFNISVPGIAAEHISVSVSGGTATKTANGKYIIRPTQDNNIQISVSANLDGRNVPMGGGQYRVKYLPDPKSYLQYKDAGGVTRQVQDGNVQKRLLASGVAIVASYGQDELVQANFEVTSFTMVTIFGPVNATGSQLSARQLGDIQKLEGGEQIFFRNIKAVGPDGRTRSLGTIVVQL
jgi:gliding motility-associated protein GldM